MMIIIIIIKTENSIKSTTKRLAEIVPVIIFNASLCAIVWVMDFG